MPDVALVDPAKEAAHELLHVLNAAGIASDSTHGEVKYFVSDAPERFSANAWIFLGGEKEIKAKEDSKMKKKNSVKIVIDVFLISLSEITDT